MVDLLHIAQDRLRETQFHHTRLLERTIANQEVIIELLVTMQTTQKSKLGDLLNSGGGLIIKAGTVLLLLVLQVPLKDIVLAIMP